MESTFATLAAISLTTYLCYGFLYGAMAFFDRSAVLWCYSGAVFLGLVSAISDALSSNSNSFILYEVAVITAIASAVLMIVGCKKMANQKTHPLWFHAALIAYTTHLALRASNLSLSSTLVPTTLYISASYSAIGLTFWSLSGNRKLFSRILSTLLLLTAIFQLQYPFARSHLEVWQFVTQLILIQLAMLMFLVLYHQEKNESIEESKRILDSYIENSPIGIAVVTRDLMIKKTNYAMEKLLGIASKNLMGTTFFSHMVEWSANNSSNKSNDAPLNPLPRDLLLRSSAGTAVPCRITSKQQDNGDILIFCEDISDEKLAERESRDLQQLVFQSSKLASLGELAASIAHEVNTPLAIIRSASEMTRAMSLPADSAKNQLKNNLNRIDTGVRRIDAIVRSMLSMARSNQQDCAHVDLKECVTDTLTFMTVLLNKDQIQTEISLGNAAMPVRVRTGEINQILTNLITNARDAMELSPIKSLRITTKIIGDKVELHVRDSGTGIQPKVAEMIFQKFFSTKTASGGTGLGLSLSKKMAEANNGELSFSTTPGEGSTFVLTLPLDKDLPLPSSAKFADSNLLQKRILLVDDERIILEALCEFLTSEGHHVVSAQTLQEARQALELQHFDVVLTDYLLTNGTGADVVSFCRNRYSRETCRVFLLSGYSPNLAVGADGFIAKPFSLNDIRDAINSHQLRTPNSSSPRLDQPTGMV